MQQTVESLGTLERRIDLTVPADAIEKEVRTRLTKLARNVKMPGFRPGKVPLKMVAQTYGAQVQAEVLNDKVGEAFTSAVTANKLRVAGQPRLEPRALEGSEDLAFSATFEVYPEIALGDLSATVVERAVCDITDADLDHTLQIMRKQRAVYESAERPAQADDVATIDFKGTRDGEPFEGGSASDFKFTLGEGRMLPEFEQALIGMSVGDSKTFPLTFPGDYSAKDLAGQTVQFEVTLKNLQQPVLPDVDAQFAKSLGIKDGDLEKMRSEVRANLEREVSTRLKARTKDSAMEALLGSTQFDVPKSLIEADQQRLAEMARNDLVARGVSVKDTPLPLELFSKQAERRVRLGLLLGEIVRANNLQPKPDQIRRLVEDIAASYEKPHEVISWYLSDRKRLADIETVVLEDNVVDWVQRNAKVVDKPIAFDELMGHASR